MRPLVQEALRLLDVQTTLDHEVQEKGKAGIYHNLVAVAQARDFFLKDLAITSAFDDQDGLAITLRISRICGKKARIVVYLP